MPPSNHLKIGVGKRLLKVPLSISTAPQCLPNLRSQTKQQIWVTAALSPKQLYFTLTSRTFLGYMLNILCALSIKYYRLSVFIYHAYTFISVYQLYFFPFISFLLVASISAPVCLSVCV